MSYRGFQKPKFTNPFLSGDWLTVAFKSKVISDLCQNRIGYILCAIAAHLPTPYPSDTELSEIVGVGRNSPGAGRASMRSPLAFLEAAGFLRVAERTKIGNKVYQLVDARRFKILRDDWTFDEAFGDFVSRRVGDLEYALEMAKTSAFKFSSIAVSKQFLIDYPLSESHWLPVDDLTGLSATGSTPNMTGLGATPSTRKVTGPGATASTSRRGEPVALDGGDLTGYEREPVALERGTCSAGASNLTGPGATQTVLTVLETERTEKRNGAENFSLCPAGPHAASPEDGDAAEWDREFELLVDQVPPNRRNRLDDSRAVWHRLRAEGRLTLRKAAVAYRQLEVGESKKKNGFPPYLYHFLANEQFRPQTVHGKGSAAEQEDAERRAMESFDYTPEPMITDRMVGDFTQAYFRQHGKSLGEMLDTDQRRRLAAFLGRGSFHTDLDAYARALERLPADPLDFIDRHHDRMPEEGLDVAGAVDPQMFSRFIMALVEKGLAQGAERERREGISPDAA